MVGAEICFECSAGIDFSLFDNLLLLSVLREEISKVLRPYLQEGYYDMTGK